MFPTHYKPWSKASVNTTMSNEDQSCTQKQSLGCKSYIKTTDISLSQFYDDTKTIIVSTAHSHGRYQECFGSDCFMNEAQYRAANQNRAHLHISVLKVTKTTCLIQLSQ